MIPKIIHYIWFGRKPFPEKVQECIDSWHKHMPEYKFMLWNEDTFDVNSVPFTKQAYDNRKWAFVSDYVRIYALHKFGGWYLDTDVEILKPLAPFENKSIVLGTDVNGELTALMGSEPEHPYWTRMLDIYGNMTFIKEDGSFNIIVNNTYLQDVLKGYGYVHENKYQELNDGIVVYPDDYFHVADLERGFIHKTKNSYAIHWHTLLWTSKMSHMMRFFRLHILKPILGEDKFLNVWNNIKNLIMK